MTLDSRVIMRIDSHFQWASGRQYMTTLKDAVGAAATATFCTLSAPVEKTLQLGEDWYNNADIPGFPSGPTPLGEGLRAARNLLCDEPPDSVDGQFNPLLPNGQCPGTIYSVSANVVINGGAPIFGGSGNGPGPINREKGVTPGGGEFDRLVDANGDLISGGGTSSVGSTYELVDIMINPVTGPDDCGASPPVPPESYNPDDWTSTPDVTYTPPSGPDVTIPVGLVFAPVVVDVDGEITVPVEVTFDTGVTVDAGLNLETGDFNFDVDISNTGDTVVEDPTLIDDPSGEPGTPPTPAEELERTIIGVYVESTVVEEDFPGTELQSATSSVKFYVPRLASVSFHCEILSATGLGWTEDIDVKYEEQVVYCPVPWGAKSVAITAQPGVTISTTIIRGESDRELLLRSAGVI